MESIIDELGRHKGQDALSMVLNILTAIGVINLVIFTGFGMSSWPIGLIRGTKSARLQIEEIQDSHLTNQTKINALKDRERIGSRLTARERRQLAKLEENERVISREEHHLLYYRSSLFYKCRKLIRPLQIVFGCVAGALSLLVWVSLLMTKYLNFANSCHNLKFKFKFLTQYWQSDAFAWNENGFRTDWTSFTKSFGYNISGISTRIPFGLYNDSGDGFLLHNGHYFWFEKFGHLVLRCESEFISYVLNEI